MRVASGYANRAESLSLFGSYPLHEAHALVDGLFGKRTDQAQALTQRYAHVNPQLSPTAKLTEGLYFYKGSVRSTRRVVESDSGRYLDLHPGEDAFVEMLNGQHSVAELDRVVQRIQQIDPRVPISMGTDLIVQLEDIGAISETQVAVG
jgi:hypothetical protein